MWIICSAARFCILQFLQHFAHFPVDGEAEVIAADLPERNEAKGLGPFSIFLKIKGFLFYAYCGWLQNIHPVIEADDLATVI